MVSGTLVMAKQMTISKWKWPDIPGLNDFKGQLIHSAAWNADVDLKGKRVCVIGNGSSGVQIVPSIIDQVDHLYMIAVRRHTFAWSPS